MLPLTGTTIDEILGRFFFIFFIFGLRYFEWVVGSHLIRNVIGTGSQDETKKVNKESKCDKLTSERIGRLFSLEQVME